jgi:hypothetical protein
MRLVDASLDGWGEPLTERPQITGEHAVVLLACDLKAVG